MIKLRQQYKQKDELLPQELKQQKGGEFILECALNVNHL